MNSAEIKERFLRFFADRGHEIVPSASLVADDPTLLLVNAGMVPFKPYFLGEQPPPWQRATSVQKCVRTADIDIVGTNTRNLSFFQMAGNFSFGDYFKAGVIPYAWGLLTASVDAGGFGLDPERLWATVYLDDDEAFRVWTEVVGLPPERVQRRGKEDNYWHMGVAGPGGPSSEIYYDRGPEHGAEGGPIVDEERYLEVWNLVFMQDVLSAARSKSDFDVAGESPTKNIDTGLGIERMAILLQGVDNAFETDLLAPILDLAATITEVRYGADHDSDVRLRVIADHTRTSTMLIADGVTPSNEGRGYVLRRMLRRVIRMLRLLGAEQPALGELVGKACDVMAPSYPEVGESRDRVVDVAVREETAFLATLRSGSALFDRIAGEVRSAGGSQLPGDQAFQLHDTFGFPIDLTLEMAREQGLSVDEDGFRRLMDEQRQRAQRDTRERKSGIADVAVYKQLVDSSGPTEFTGYDETEAEGHLRGLLVGGQVVESAVEGDHVELTLDRTPFYAEGGGQLADHGRIQLADGTVIEVYDAQKPVGELVVHRGRVVSGTAVTGAAGHAGVDVERRRALSRAHTATHLVHAAIRRAIGDEATQAGSQNDAGRFRFDFSSPAAVPPAVLADVEAEVNDVLLADMAVRAFVTTQAEARRIGALANFGDKYGDAVRVVEVGEYSRELCGGTHAAHSAQLGLVKLLSEASIGTGKRRIEGLVGADAYTYLAREHLLVSQLTDLLKATPDELVDRVGAAISRVRELEKDLEKLRGAAVLSSAGDIAAAAVDEAGVAVVVHHAPDGATADDLRSLVIDVRNRMPGDRPAVAAAAAVTDGRPVVVVATNQLARERGLSAGALVREAAAVLGGGGGGRDDVAQGGGSRPEAIADAMAGLRNAVGRQATAG